MNTLEGLPILDHYNHLLSKTKEKDAWAVLHEFFDFFNEESPKEYLWFMLTLALKYDSEEIEARHRSKMLFFYEYCIALFKAAYILSQKQNKKKQRRKSH